MGERYKKLMKDMSEFRPSDMDENEFGYCEKHGDYYGNYKSFCPLCVIEDLEKQNLKIMEIFKKIIIYHISINAPLGMKQLIKFLQEILNELEED